VKTGMSPLRSKSGADMSDLAVLAEAAIGLVSVELTSEKNRSIQIPKPNLLSHHQQPGSAPT
jgi:hypothetical protein